MKKNGLKRRQKITISLLSILFTLIVVLSVFTLVQIKKMSDEQQEEEVVVYTQDEVDKLIEEAKEEAVEEGRKSLLNDVRYALESGKSVLAVLKTLYPEKLVVASQGLYHWVDIIDELGKNSYDINNLVIDEETGEYTYVVDGEVKSKKGIDVSSHQGKIDWTKVADDGVEFAFIRGVYRGYGSGKLVEDDYCIKNLKAAKSAGIDVGVYVFSQAISKEEAIEEADAVLDLLDGMHLDLPIVYDVERVSSNDARMNALTVEERTDMALTFLNRISEAGYDTMIYHNTEMGALLIDMKEFSDYPKWFAGYTEEFYWPYEYNIWQYSEKGSVKGIKGAVDMDIMLIQ